MTTHLINNISKDIVADDALRELIGDDLIAILLGAAEAIRFRVLKSADHFEKAKRLAGIDEEMGAIRLIAAEEELVIAIFEALKANADAFPEHKDFVRHFKKHPVKLSFMPVLLTFKSAFAPMLNGMTFEGLEDRLSWKPVLAVRDGKVVLVLIDQSDGKELVALPPLNGALTPNGEGETPDLIYRDLEAEVKRLYDFDIPTFVAVRAEFRNTILYAGDEGFYRMADTFDELLSTFSGSLRSLSWVLAIVLTGPPPSKSWGVVAQFIEVYRRVLKEYWTAQSQKAQPKPQIVEPANKEA